jgi:hypothetical protein
MSLLSTMRNGIPLIFLAVTSIAAPASARAIETWSYERLFKEADVAVIASARETVDAPDFQARDPRHRPILAAQRTTLAVNAVLKGHAADGPITVLHFRLKEERGLMRNGPMLVRFRTAPPVIEGRGFRADLGTPHYLLFLKRSADGVLEPVSGQFDPELSVKEIYAPLPTSVESKS